MAADVSGNMLDMIGQLQSFIFDCSNIDEAASFYEEVLGMRRVRNDDDWIEITDGNSRVCFQLAPGHKAPTWPDDAVPQQAHLDVEVDDLDEGEQQVLKLGAKRLPGAGEGFRVFSDPVGHPFCLVLHD